MSLYRKFKTSEKHEKEGIELDYGDGAIIRIARAGGSNKAYLREMEKRFRKYRRQLQLGLMSNDVANKILREVFAGTIVLGWEGITDEHGEPLDFTFENTIKVFEDLPDLFNDLRESAENAELFREEVREDDAKN